MSLLDHLPPVIKNQVVEEDVKSVNGEIDKPFIIVHSRPLEQEEKDLLRSYGTLIEWSSAYRNIPLAKHKFHYMTCDINNKDVRMLLMTNPMDAYHVIVLCRKWEAEDDFIDDVHSENVLRTLPSQQAFKNDFDKLLLSAKIRAPSCTKALLRLFLSLFSGYSPKH